MRNDLTILESSVAVAATCQVEPFHFALYGFPQVRDGSRVSQDLPDYFDRVKTTGSNIEILNVNYSDVGHYTLRERRHRVVSITRMDLTGALSVLVSMPSTTS